MNPDTTHPPFPTTSGYVKAALEWVSATLVRDGAAEVVRAREAEVCKSEFAGSAWAMMTFEHEEGASHG